MQSTGIDIDQLSDKLMVYLRDELDNPEIEYYSPLVQLQGGYETSTYRFQLKGVGDELSKNLVMRLYPQFYGSRNAIWESTVQNVLAGEGYPAPIAHFVCTDMSVLGGAFFIMDYIPGQPLMYAPPGTVPGLLGTTHAALHQIDPEPLIESLEEQGVDGYGYSLESRYDWLKNRAGKLPWIRDAVSWLIDNRPPEPTRLVVCHGDFHALNILVQDGAVTGVLDWPGFAITDPVFDVANTIVLTTIPAKHLAVSLGEFSTVDWDLAAELYLSAYRSVKPMDSSYLDFYRVKRCVMGSVQGIEGQKVWQHPMIVNDLAQYIDKVTGIRVSVPVYPRSIR